MMAMRLTGCSMRAAAIFLPHFRHQANRPPTTPKHTPSTARRASVLGSKAVLTARGTSNFSSPRAPDVALAAMEEVRAGKSACSSSLPATSTSSANSVAASGVRNSPAKPAAMPTRRKVLPGCLNGSLEPIQCESVAPICTATPSRPALPPNRCVIQVPPMMSGMRRSGITFSCPRPTSNTRLMPRPVFLPKRR